MRLPLSAVAAACVLALATRADACSVPVFRYALERWPPDSYEAIVFHRGDLPPEAKTSLELLRSKAKETGANVEVQTADLAGDLEPDLARLWDRRGGPGDAGDAERKLPLLVLRSPKGSTFEVVWTAPFERSAIERLLASPLRKTIRDKLVSGDTAVWVFVASGHREADDQAFETLSKELSRLERELKLPEIQASDLELAGLTREESDKLRISFPIVRLERSDPAEEVLLEMLLRCEPDLLPQEGEEIRPMAFPIFGRARALYALVGGGIHPVPIERAAQFLIGPCSCQVKAENPGMDLLLAARWDELVTTDSVPDRAPPELVGLNGFVVISDLTGDGAPSEVPPSGDDLVALDADFGSTDEAKDEAKDEASSAGALAASEADTGSPDHGAMLDRAPEEGPSTPAAEARALSEPSPAVSAAPADQAASTSAESKETESEARTSDENASGESGLGSRLLRNVILSVGLGLALVAGMALGFRARGGRRP